MTQSTETQSTDTSSAALVALLSKNANKGTGRRRLWLIGGGIAVVAVLWLALSGGNGQPAGQYLTEEAVVGNLLVTASASGTLQPTKSVDVGSELSGTLSSVLVQENDVVKKGQRSAWLLTLLGVPDGRLSLPPLTPRSAGAVPRKKPSCPASTARTAKAKPPRNNHFRIAMQTPAAAGLPHESQEWTRFSADATRPARNPAHRG